MIELTPKQIVAELDRFLIGQEDAKRMVAIALRNRWRRKRLPEALQADIQPKNILMVGPTGVGKSEIARRVARLSHAPFIKVEATKFTEVGYVGRDVDSIIRDLLEVCISQIHSERVEAVKEQATEAAVQRLVDLIVQQEEVVRRNGKAVSALEAREPVLTATDKRRLTRRRGQIAKQLAHDELGTLAAEWVDVDVDVEVAMGERTGPIESVAGVAADDLHDALHGVLESFATRQQQRRMTVSEARRVLISQESQRLISREGVVQEAIARVQDDGVVFIDEIDKTIQGGAETGSDISGEGVQRDLLGIVEGSVVVTRHGPVHTDHILFIAAGSFSANRPSDLIPEIQGRFPLRAELHSLDEDDLYDVLTIPENALPRQLAALLAADGVSLDFQEDGLREIAGIAADVNARSEDIGARRLHTVVERILEEVSFDAPEIVGSTVVIDAAYVTERIGDVATEEDLSNAIL